MTPPPEPLPENFGAWKKSTCTLNGRVVCIARRSGVTLHLVHDEDEWTITKFRGGRVLAERVLKNIPNDIRKSVFAAHPAGRRR